MNLLPPLRLLQEWRESGLTPQEIYTRCEEMNETRKKALSQVAAKETKTPKQEAARIERERQRQRDTERIRSLREQGKTWQEIGQEIGRSGWYLRRLAKSAGLPNFRVKPKSYFHRPRKLPSDEELVRLLETKSVREICDFYSVTPIAVYSRLDRAGIPRRRYKPRGKS